MQFGYLHCNHFYPHLQINTPTTLYTYGIFAIIDVNYMRKKYSNEIFTIIEKSGLDPAHFEIERTPEVGIATLTAIGIKNSSLKFIIKSDPTSFDKFTSRYTRFNPGFTLSEFNPATYAQFENVAERFQLWLTSHAKPYLDDCTDVDLWDQYSRSYGSIDLQSLDFNEQSEFSKDEKKHISAAIQNLKLLIVTQFQLQGQEIKLIHERLDYLSDAVDRLNKFDWKSLVISTILGIITTLTLDTEKGKQLFLLFKKVFGSIPKLLLSHA